MRTILFLVMLKFSIVSYCQVPVNFDGFKQDGKVKAQSKGSLLTITWPAGDTKSGRIIINTKRGQPLFESIELSNNGNYIQISSALDPVFILTTGKRDLVSQNGWNIFFDSTNRGPHKQFLATLDKRSASVFTSGSRTIIKITEVSAGSFSGDLEITLYNGSPLFNVAAVVSTKQDSTAILYDAGLVNKSTSWNDIAWSDTKDSLQIHATQESDTSTNVAVICFE